ncbi:MAG: nucleoside hydrolase [Bacteroidales bacterium]|nr:nucleoside hydrolase [Bacteroidales bacterium]
MRIIVVSLLVILIAPGVLSQPLSARLKHTVIIDTDCGIDDMRAISLMLARPEITIKAILSSDGSLPPAEGAGKIYSLLREFGRDNIPIASGDVVDGINPAWRPFNSSIIWGSQIGGQITYPGSADYLSETLRNENEKITLVCLGALTNIARVAKIDEALLSGIERIIWYNDSARPLEGFNYECDRESAELLLKSGVSINIISNLDKADASFDLSLYSICQKSNTLLAGVLRNVFNQQPVLEKLNQTHFRLCDDLVVIYLTNPELFGINIMTDNLYIRYNQDYNVEGVREAISDMITGKYVSERNIVFSRFPVQREMYNYDVRPIIDSAILRYGYDEWKANVMTDEFHGHLGVFSIVGAKMGIKARELFGVGTDMLEVTTYAGTEPPYSCLNDGIQVSTGATLGMGTIHLAARGKTVPSAVFTYKNRSVRISLKKEYLEQVDADINEGIEKFGLMDDGYWKLIRHNALKYWVEWDRDKIFDIEEIGPKK